MSNIDEMLLSDGNDHGANVFKPVGLFATPSSWMDLQSRIEQLSGSEKTIAYTYAMMAWNLACMYHEKEGHNDEG